MKYAKAEVESRLEKYLKRVEEAEETSYQNEIKLYLTRLGRREQVRKSLNEVFEWLSEGAAITSDESWVELEKRIRDIQDTRYGRMTRGTGELFSVAAEEIFHPTKYMRESDDLREVISIFKTGAPPEVSMNDLRGFNLLKIVKYGRA